ncbi:ABC transporter permease [Acidimangrovimonas sediminis]|uniref:ABC transporter permease n=1 Tax=Acidimangrovimonas sediminis TaxID=2056283 RepID=UPI000C807ABB|nr:ABC transporter permease [Acidimangrovimonas sediminis]
MKALVRSMMVPHRIVLLLIGVAIFGWAIYALDWSWLPEYIQNGLLLKGLWTTIYMLVISWAVGLFLAIWLGLAQAAGPWYLALPAKGFCSVIRGTPLLLQLWFFYYGLGSIFPHFPSIRESWAWEYLRQAWPYALFSLTLSFAGYEGEVMRGAFLGVPKGQLEAARAYGMPRFTILRRIWLPQAVRRVLPTMGGETVLQLKSTPLIATITVLDLYQASLQIRQDTYIIYEPLLLLAVIYLIVTGIIVALFHLVERQVPSKRS